MRYQRGNQKEADMSDDRRPSPSYPRAHGRHRSGGRPPENPRRVAGEDGALWLFGLHAVRDALLNPLRVKKRLILTQNAVEKLADAVAASGLTPQIDDPRQFSAPIDPGSVHQGAALECEPLDWGSVSECCAPGKGRPPVVVLLDRVTDPHNVGAILRSAEVFGARAVIAPRWHSAPETGALAKAASGALERQPYLQVPNLARAMEALHQMGYVLVGLDGQGQTPIQEACATFADRPIGLVMGAEGPGLRQLTRESCDMLARIDSATEFASLNVSNAAAVALFAVSLNRRLPQL